MGLLQIIRQFFCTKHEWVRRAASSEDKLAGKLWVECLNCGKTSSGLEQVCSGLVFIKSRD